MEFENTKRKPLQPNALMRINPVDKNICKMTRTPFPNTLRHCEGIYNDPPKPQQANVLKIPDPNYYLRLIDCFLLQA
jgi:hypothetical protein